MTKQLRATMAAILVISTISLPAQTSTANKTTDNEEGSCKEGAGREPDRARDPGAARADAEPAGPDRRPEARERSTRMPSSPPPSSPHRVQRRPPPPHPPRPTASAPASRPTPRPSRRSTAPSPTSRPPTSASPRPSATPRSPSRDQIDNPLAIRYKGVTITPVAFFAFEACIPLRARSTPTSTPRSTRPPTPERRRRTPAS